jgi:sodium/potassium/calcium exchanger 6
MIQNESMAASSSCSRRRHDDNNISTTASQIISAVAIAIGCIICLMLLLSSSNQSNNHRSSRRLFATYFSNDENYEPLASAAVAGTAEKTPSEAQLLAAQQDNYNRRQLSKHLKQLKQNDPTQQQPQYHVDYTKYSCDSMNDPSLLTKLMLQQEQKRVRLKETDENNNTSDKIDDRKTSSLPTNNEQPQQQQQQQQLLIDKCQFAKTCNDGQGVGFGSRLFCSTTSTSTFYSTISNTLTIILLLTTLLLLFRLLNSTTDEFFSPGLELFSLKLGLPPRFAGVTLLALGNGAPDVAATMNATLDSHEGYLMALGELTGTSMFVSGVILGVIVSLDSTTTITNPARRNCSDKDHVEGKEDEERGKDGTNTTPSHTTDDDDDMIIQPNKNETRSGGVVGVDKVVVGVPCQGPLLRDIAMLMLVCIVSMSYLERGVVDYGFVHTLLAMYAVYVLTVLGADIYHLFYHLPMVRRSESGVSLCNAAVVEGGEGGRGSGEEDDGHEKNATVCSSDEDRNDGLVTNEQTPLVVATTHQHHDQHQHNHQLRHHHSQPVPVHHHSIRDSVIEAMSNYSCDEERQREEQIIIFHPHHAVHPHHENGPMLLRDIFRRGPLATRRGGVGSVGGGKTQSARQTIRKSVSDGITSFHSWSSSNSAPVNTDNDVATSSSSNHAKQMISSLDDVTTPVISGPLLSESNSQEDTQSTTESQINNEQSNDHSRMNASATKPNSWGEAWKSNVQEFKEHWNDFFLDIYCNEENGKMDVILLSMELPFTIIRKVSPSFCVVYRV